MGERPWSLDEGRAEAILLRRRRSTNIASMRFASVLALSALGCSYPEFRFAASTDTAVDDSAIDGGADANEIIDVGDAGDASDTGQPADARLEDAPADGAHAEVSLDAGHCPSDMVETSAMGKTFCIDRYEVTNEQYAAYLLGSPALGAQPAVCAWNTDIRPGGIWPPPPSTGKLPVVYVDWCDAWLYCHTRGKRLCGRVGGGPIDTTMSSSLADEFTASCATTAMHTYPYGDAFDPMRCNGADAKLGRTAPVGAFSACQSLAGTFDQTGNAAEWENSCAPAIPGDGGVESGVDQDRCLFRGGDFRGMVDSMNCTHSYSEYRSARLDVVGIRCCSD